MSAPRSGPWIGGTVAVSLTLGLAGWFLAISPTLATASETRTAAQAQEDQNGVAEARIASLKEQFTQIDQLKAELAAMRLQIPTSYDLAAYQRELTTLAGNHSVVITSLQTGPAMPVTVAAAEPAAAPAEDAESTGSTAEAGTDAAATPAPAAPSGPVGFYAMSTSLNIVGSYQNVLGFLSSLQTGSQRLLLVESLTGTALTESEAAGGRPATVLGDLELAVTGSLYVLTPSATAPPVVDPAAAPPALPVPDPAKNPFAPLG